MAVSDSVTLYSDILDYITALTDGGARTKDLRMHKEAILGAYRDISMGNEWAYYIAEGRIDLDAKYSTGKVTYTASTRTLVIQDGGTWPSWIKYGRIRIDDSVYTVEKTTDTAANIILDASNCPAANISSAVTYDAYRTEYPLPDDMWRLYDVGVEKNNWVTYYITPTEWQQRERYLSSGGQTWAWTIMKNSDADGKWSLFVDPYPTESEPLMFMYRRKPRTLRWAGTEVKARASSTQNATASATNTYLTTDTELPASMVGAVIRLSETTTHPTGLAGVNPYYEQHKISSISGTTVNLDDAIGKSGGYANKYFVVSDPVDMSESMIEAFKAEVEYRIARMSNDQRDTVQARRIADYQLRRSLEAESRFKESGGYNRQSRYSYLFTNLQNVITTSS